MKYVLHPSRVDSTTRNSYSFVCGLVFGLTCFGIVYVLAPVVQSFPSCTCVIPSQSDDMFVLCSWNLLFVPVNLVTKSNPHVSLIIVKLSISRSCY